LRAAAAFNVDCRVLTVAMLAAASAATVTGSVTVAFTATPTADSGHGNFPVAIFATRISHAGDAAALATALDLYRTRAPVALVLELHDQDDHPEVLALLVPRASIITARQAQVTRLLVATEHADITIVPELAERLLSMGAQAVHVDCAEESFDETCAEGMTLDWIATPQASGWLSSVRMGRLLPQAGSVLATSAAAALSRGYGQADALVLASMTRQQVLRRASRAPSDSIGAPDAGFALDPDLLPMLSPGRLPRFARRNWLQRTASVGRAAMHAKPGLYAVVDSHERLAQVLDAGLRTIQLRIKAPAHAGLRAHATWQAFLYRSVQRSVALCRERGADLYINDHWSVAQSVGAFGVHMGQEDLIALDDVQHAQLMASGMALGISTHSLWELCRARAFAPHYVACGPVWPTTTKDMPWRAQGLPHLAWWCAMAQTHVVAIGGIVAATQVTEAARTGADHVCILRALGDDPSATVPALELAWHRGHDDPVRIAPSAYPPASLPSEYGLTDTQASWHAACGER
jgi:thiamine-phosphate diphosphorylase